MACPARRAKRGGQRIGQVQLARRAVHARWRWASTATAGGDPTRVLVSGKRRREALQGQHTQEHAGTLWRLVRWCNLARGLRGGFSHEEENKPQICTALPREHGPVFGRMHAIFWMGGGAV